MKIILIRQAETDMPWAERCDAAGFEQALRQELACHIVPVSVRKGDASAYRVFTGTSPASAETAELLFDLKNPPVRTPLLDDVPLRAFQDTQALHTPRFWLTAARAQWTLGSARQPETRRQTERRAGEFVDMLEKDEFDSVVVCRGLTMTALKSVLRRRGYVLEGGGLRPVPLERVRASRKSLHCGGCARNCLLSEARCQTGINRAKGIR